MKPFSVITWKTILLNDIRNLQFVLKKFAN
jgi:hypothetical protein